MIDYYINGVNLADIGIRVQSSKGVVDVPKLKKPPEFSWNEYSGVSVDLRNKKYEAREIELSCFMTADNNVQLAERMQNLFKNFLLSQIMQLRIFITPTKPLVFMVYCQDKIEVKKNWRENGKIISTFNLKFIETEPEKVVLFYPSGANAFISIQTETPTNIYLCDYSSGSFKYATSDNELIDYINKEGGNITHQYYNNAMDKYAVITGNTENLNLLLPSYNVIWNFGFADITTPF